jgi:hypothetical protein
VTDSTFLEVPIKKTKFKTNSVRTLSWSMEVNDSTPTLLAPSVELRSVPNQELRLVSDSNIAVCFRFRSISIKEETKGSTKSRKDELKTSDGVIMVGFMATGQYKHLYTPTILRGSGP